jgi:hypothetical protein
MVCYPIGSFLGDGRPCAHSVVHGSSCGMQRQLYSRDISEYCAVLARLRGSMYVSVG